MRARRWIGIADALPEALRLAEQGRRELDRLALPGFPSAGTGLVDGVRGATLAGRLLVGPKDEAIALAVWEPGVPKGRRATVVLDEGFRSPAVLAGIVDALRADPASGPLLAVQDPVLGLSDVTAEEVLAARGFERLLRVDFVDGGAPLPVPHPAPGLRSVRPADAAALAELLEEGYRDNPADRALFWREKDAHEDARASIAMLVEGGLGTFWEGASFVVPAADEGGRLDAATLVNDFHGPLLTEVIVAPRARRKGFARQLIGASVAAVRARTDRPLRLVVTLRNRRAYRLYDSLGWRRVDASMGGPWVDPAAFGLGALDPPFDP